MSQKGFDGQCNLSIKKCLSYTKKRLFHTKRSFYTPVVLISTLFLMLGFQNCTDQGVKELRQVNGPNGSDLIAELSLTQTKHPDLLEISASLDSKVQDDFPAGSTVDLALSPSTHKNLEVLEKSDVYTKWTISNEAWNGYSYYPYYNYPCELITTCEVQEDDIEICTSTKASCYKSSVYETVTTIDEDTQFQFSDVGVYDISAFIQEIEPPTMITHPDGTVTQGDFTYTSHGPRYEKSLVVGKCDQGDLQIISAKDPIQNPPLTTTTTTAQVLNSINSIASHDHFSSSYRYQQASRYASLFLLELDGKILEFEDYSYYGGYNINMPTKVPSVSVPPATFGTTEIDDGGRVSASISGSSGGSDSDESFLPHLPSEQPSYYYDYSYERKVKWNLMAEVIDPTYGRWYYKFNQQDRLGGWYVPWPEDDTLYFYNDDYYHGTSTPGAKFSGKFIMEAFVQFPEGECVYSAKKAFQLSGNLIPSIEVMSQPCINGNCDGGTETPTTTTQTVTTTNQNL